MSVLGKTAGGFGGWGQEDGWGVKEFAKPLNPSKETNMFKSGHTFSLEEET